MQRKVYIFPLSKIQFSQWFSVIQWFQKPNPTIATSDSGLNRDIFTTYSKSVKSVVSMSVFGINAEVFRIYVRDVLLPTLKAGDILMMNNLSSYKDKEALAILREAGVTVRFLPAYSPDYNPIEMMWSKVKALLRKAEARTNETLLRAIGNAHDQVTGKDASHWFAHCGYNFI